jgi:hypothetical protein
MRKSKKPFYFNTSEHLLRIGREKAASLSENFLMTTNTKRWLFLFQIINALGQRRFHEPLTRKFLHK